MIHYAYYSQLEEIQDTCANLIKVIFEKAPASVYACWLSRSHFSLRKAFPVDDFTLLLRHRPSLKPVLESMCPTLLGRTRALVKSPDTAMRELSAPIRASLPVDRAEAAQEKVVKRKGRTVVAPTRSPLAAGGVAKKRAKRANTKEDRALTDAVVQHYMNTHAKNAK